jgi:hypothetical protein
MSMSMSAFQMHCALNPALYSQVLGNPSRKKLLSQTIFKNGFASEQSTLGHRHCDSGSLTLFWPYRNIYVYAKFRISAVPL